MFTRAVRRAEGFTRPVVAIFPMEDGRGVGHWMGPLTLLNSRGWFVASEHVIRSTLQKSKKPGAFIYWGFPEADLAEGYPFPDIDVYVGRIDPPPLSPLFRFRAPALPLLNPVTQVGMSLVSVGLDTDGIWEEFVDRESGTVAPPAESVRAGLLSIGATLCSAGNDPDDPLRNRFLLDRRTRPSHSGGPVLDRRGVLWGLAESVDELEPGNLFLDDPHPPFPVTACVGPAALKACLDEVGVKYRTEGNWRTIWRAFRGS